MIMQIEVCIDNLESLHYAQQGGATRIELCSSLALGGLTPSAGFMRLAAKHATIPVYAMIRPRQGDFLFSSDDVEIMLADVHAAKQAQLQGIVVGALTADGHIDRDILNALMKQASTLGVTFHRAIDQCADPFAALDAVMQAGCERVLTSGLAPSAPEGIAMIKRMVGHCGNHLSIMPGAGVTANNALSIIQQTAVHEIHLSGKSTRPSLMQHIDPSAHMGNANVDDFAIPITSAKKISAVVEKIQTL
ncbi:copper homeostasis protein CutC [Photobacterium sanguinicancri]|uniref:copper homeostasis protein CutC n=1 Tax=Photobacterium sanguinicancri TaxID=875932 RepID=UPI0026E16B0B|nr:copper homeostasis protein CutC [Photobacterium sanguinicancri]MDO6497703.1 copper homeostasis protein CutC [Photobacterium sanguinicancri]